MTTTALSPAFSHTLRESTLDQHRAAERAPYIVRLMSGELSLSAYADLLWQLLEVYRALEEVAEDVADDPLAGGFVDRRLNRLPALTNDLAAICGPSWRGQSPGPLPATLVYAASIRAAAERWPSAFVAHHYTRYLGDLSGGQVIARMLRTRYGLADDALRMYAFAGVRGPEVKRAYRERLDRTAWSPAEHQQLIAETAAAYDHNRAIFEQLAGRHS